MQRWLRLLRYLRPPLIAVGILINLASIALSAGQVWGLSLPSRVWVDVGTTLILLVAIHWIVTLVRENAALQQSLMPQVKIVFDRDRYPACFQESKWTNGGTHGIDRTFRVGLVNPSEGQTVDDVEVSLAEIVGLDRPQDTRFLPVPLPRMASTPFVGGEVFRPFSLHPGPTPVFVEVAFKRSTVSHISLRYADHWPNTLESDNRYTLRIAVKSRNAREVNASFLMSVDQHGVLNFEADTRQWSHLGNPGM
jgi:hypothetical protein